MEAIVLAYKPLKESDREVDLFTKDLGRIRAKAIGGRKTLSKFAPHLDPLNRVRVRLVKKNGVTITDVLEEDRFERLRKTPHALRYGLELTFLLRKLLEEAMPDERLWFSLVRAFTNHTIRLRTFLKLLGYDPLHARCEMCGSTRVNYFTPRDQAFLCAACSIKFPANEVLYI